MALIKLKVLDGSPASSILKTYTLKVSMSSQIKKCSEVFLWVVMKAVKVNASNLKFASEDLKDNETIGLAALNRSTRSLQHASERV